MRGLSRKQVSASRGLWVRVPRLPLLHKHSPVVQRQRLLAYTQATMVRFHPGLLTVQLRRAAGVSLRVLLGHIDQHLFYVLVGELGRPRHPVTVEIVGSNPIEDAF